MPRFKRNKKKSAPSDDTGFSTSSPEGARADLGRIWPSLAKFRKDWTMTAISCNCV